MSWGDLFVGCHNLSVVYYAQDHLDALHLDLTALQELSFLPGQAAVLSKALTAGPGG